MELITIKQTENGIQTVLATDLYNFLEPKTQFKDWIERMLKYGFIENSDYWTFYKFRSNLSEKELTPKMRGIKRGRTPKEYVLSLDCAKFIAMVQRSEKGKQIRTYFIEVEKQYKEIATPQQIQDLYTRLIALENKQIDYPNDWTIDRYLQSNKLYDVLTKSDRQQLGKLCTKLSKLELGREPKKIPHPTYLNGQNVYPYELINKAFELWKNK